MTTTELDLEWHRYALISEIAERMQEQNTSLGKTALQKLVYFLQELHGVDCGYEFTLYTYGPFSAQLLGDLDSARSMGAVEVSYVIHTGGYFIEPGEKSADIRDRAKKFLKSNASAIESVVSEFGRLTAKGLELRATIVYADRDAKASGRIGTVDEIVEVVHDLKPHFGEAMIRTAYGELLDKRYVG